MNALPEEFVERLKQIIPDSGWTSVYGSFSTDKPPVARINTEQTNTTAITQNLTRLGIAYEQPDWKPDALIFQPQHRDAILTIDSYQRGLLYNQNLSNQLAPMAL
jgi:16S rRNA C967 or C1407 C5-methylase (RsmB/RsmF family)